MKELILKVSFAHVAPGISLKVGKNVSSAVYNGFKRRKEAATLICICTNWQ